MDTISITDVEFNDNSDDEILIVSGSLYVGVAPVRTEAKGALQIGTFIHLENNRDGDRVPHHKSDRLLCADLFGEMEELTKERKKILKEILEKIM